MYLYKWHHDVLAFFIVYENRYFLCSSWLHGNDVFQIWIVLMIPSISTMCCCAPGELCGNEKTAKWVVSNHVWGRLPPLKLVSRSKNTSLQWCYNDRSGVSNHQPHTCLLNRLFRRRSKKTSKLSFRYVKCYTILFHICYVYMNAWFIQSFYSS